MNFFKEIQQPVKEASRPDAYQRDEINATSGFGKNSQAYRADGGANDEDHEGDAWREKQEKSGTWYIRLNGKLIKDKTGKPYSFHGKAAANKAALTMQAKLFNQGKEFMLTTNPNDKPQGVAEGEEHSPVASAITRRIMLQRHDLLSKYGPVLVTQAIDEVADFVGDVEEIGSSDVSGWIKQVEQMLANNPAEAFGESLNEDLQADDGEYYSNADKFFGQFEAESFDNEETSPDGMEVRGYIDGVNVMVWRYDDESMTSGYGYYDDSAMQEGVAEASLAQMRDYFNKPDDSTSVTRAPATAGKNPAGVPQEIQILINKMYHSGKVTPEEFKMLQDFQRKTKINVGIKEASTGNAGYDSMLAVMKAVDAGQDATFNLGGEPITLDYNEARFLAGRYKAFLKAGRQEEFLKYMENPMSFDHLMKQLRDLIDKQKNFKGSVEGERGIEEGSERVDTLVTKGLGLMRGPTWLDAVAAIKYQVGERDYRERKEFYDFFVKQLVDRYGKKPVAEAGFPGAPDVEMPPMKPSGDPQRDKLKQEYMDLHSEIKSLVDIPYSSNASPEQKMQAKARIKQLNDRADQIKAILEPRLPPNEWQKKTYGYDDNWNIVKKGVAEDAPALAKMAGGLGVGLVAAAGAPAIVSILGPLLGIPFAAYGAYSAAKLGMKGVEKLWDMAAEKLGGDDKVEQYTQSKIAGLPPEEARAAAAVVNKISESRKSIRALPQVNENEYWCKIDSVAKPIPEGYKRTANGYITRT